ncbi:hypothetical protein TrRE_jg10510 [Triparma retinervis]|uniref:Uncharacterized protein n=1 Tax=Triparma retinervis TaxID=2557542 RepID=A0A9W7ARL0_9STRA|nr:hypothetical protein TrRE_jg10510 [Triparma retinervis]
MDHVFEISLHLAGFKGLELTGAFEFTGAFMAFASLMINDPYANASFIRATDNASKQLELQRFVNEDSEISVESKGDIKVAFGLLRELGFALGQNTDLGTVTYTDGANKKHELCFGTVFALGLECSMAMFHIDVD